ncbi:MAG: hypothetical protein ABL908_13675 [Hyphomicrobium sp.]
MFGFLRRRLLKEHMKLFAQSQKALAYCRAFMTAEQADNVEMALAGVEGRWQPGQRMGANDVEMLLSANKVLRRAYDASPARVFGLKSFDDQFVPLLGWDEYFTRYLE